MCLMTQEVDDQDKVLDAEFAHSDSDIHNIPELKAADINLATQATTEAIDTATVQDSQGEDDRKPAASSKPKFQSIIGCDHIGMFALKPKHSPVKKERKQPAFNTDDIPKVSTLFGW